MKEHVMYKIRDTVGTIHFSVNKRQFLIFHYIFLFQIVGIKLFLKKFRIVLLL